MTARVVVGADGRFSTVRRLAGVDPGLFRSDIELVWLKLPGAAFEHPVEAVVDDAGQLLKFGLNPEEGQVGWFLPSGTYPTLREAGIDAFRRRLLTVDPTLEPVLSDALASFEQCSLLHIEPGISEEWVRDGLVLVGDAAHVASPVGGQGNRLAVHDAVALHGVLVRALRADDASTDGAPTSGDDDSVGAGDRPPLSATRLRPFERERRPAVERVVRRQRAAEAVLTTLVTRGDRVPRRLKRLAVRALLAVVPRVAGRVARSFGFDADPPRVATEYFVDGSVPVEFGKG